jgi:hypothetical protein
MINLALVLSGALMLQLVDAHFICHESVLSQQQLTATHL